ncbi:histidine kinase [Tieghemostelium lacteum]|uniref:Histidine kinase n=1 Tax=Tieghemostelium lacteum TaxID=361077 RepID=A0A151ZFV6_TIELA|nr:histidine kinase [Tieghemostelium lacteum]|eukprot:KYQ92799.1 histidine kinase [Tieghemostelium lacteum]
MSFKLSWGPFDENFYNNIKDGLNKALNQNPIPNLTDKLLVYQLGLGDHPPQLELLEVDPSKEHFKFVFKVLYKGNGLLELRTKVQANPIFMGSSVTHMNRREKTIMNRFGLGSAGKPHVMPLSIMIKDIVFEGILTLSIINTTKIEASFKEDPLKQVNIVTSFDEFPSAANFIKTLVETQLRDFIMKEFPVIVGSITVPAPSSPQMPTHSQLVQVTQQQSENSTSFLSSSSTQPSTTSSPMLNNQPLPAIPNSDFSLLQQHQQQQQQQQSTEYTDQQKQSEDYKLFKQLNKSKKKSNLEYTATTDYIQ